MNAHRRSALRALGGLAALLALYPAVAQMPNLITRSIPSSGEPLPVIGLGTWQVFDAGNNAAARAPLKEVLRVFFAAGGRLLDSSPMYGSSESVVGDLCAELSACEPLFMATKVWTRGREEGIREMETSLRLMKVQQMDLMQVHNLLDVATHTRTLLDWKAQGRVRHIGITHYSASAHAEVEKTLTAAPYDFLQINYSLAEREAEHRLLPLALERRVAVIANRPFAEGALFRRVRGKPLPDWAKKLGIESWAQYFLKWILGHPAITAAIPGTGKAQHMADNLAAGRGSLPDDAQRRRMAAHFDAL
ncbi:MAG: aldo/keto reductase [Betaproteobacteria bacterium]|nr:aldo/keto reductase [Betaproteobacteria bacterium]